MDWVSLEFDPRCATAQPEDTLQIFIKNPSKSPSDSQAVSGAADSQQPVQKYTPVLTKFSGTTGYPKNSVILPGNEVLFSLETASDYIKDVNEEKVMSQAFRSEKKLVLVNITEWVCAFSISF